MDRTRQYESIYDVYFKFVFVELAILIGEMNTLFFSALEIMFSRSDERKEA
jgi:hypothetical protein